MKNFESKEDAISWMEEQIDDNCIDNYRFAFLDNKKEIYEYEGLKGNGCCGFFDEEIMVNGREAIIGCNYGH